MTITAITIILYIFIFLFGACTFSFVNVLVYRVPKGIPFGNERSICPKCGNILKPYDMVPVLGYMWLGGKCRFCKEKISIRYPLIETLGGVLALLCARCYLDLQEIIVRNMLQLILTFVLFSILAAISFIDIDTLEIPNGLVFVVLICGILSIFLFPKISLLERGIGVICISVPLLLITIVIPGAFGGGDIKLMAALGVFLGWKWSVAAFAFAVLTGGTYGIFLLLSKKKSRKEHFAFGPFLCVGAMIAILYGNTIINWYLGFYI